MGNWAHWVPPALDAVTTPTAAFGFSPWSTLRRLAFALVLLASLTAPAQTAAPGAPLQAIERPDAVRYLGTWYEIAKYPNRFQRQCVADTQAQYQQRNDDQLDDINRCHQANGELTEAVCRARQAGSADSPKLEVRFALAWLA